ncbi:MAG TPA: magnesium transporter CorA family protein [Clostridiales bacterium]|nr:magnesium transporter CorA family protein [Clostridiales bacterium]
MITFYKTFDGIVKKIENLEEDCWVNVISPKKDELEFLKTQLQIPDEFLMSSLDEEESSHIETEGQHTLIIIDMPYAEDAGNGVTEYYTMPIGIVMMKGYIITISTKPNPVIESIAKGAIKNLNTAHRTQFVLHLLLRMSMLFLQYLKQIDKRSSALEKQLRVSMRNKELIQLLELEKSLVYFQTSLKSDEITLEKILRSRSIKLYEEDQDLLEDVIIEIKQAIEMSNIYLSILSGTMDAFASLISNNLNIVMKVLTSITIVMAIPEIIFSFYGMNIGLESALPFAGTVWVPLMLTVVIGLIVSVWLYKKGMFK